MSSAVSYAIKSGSASAAKNTKYSEISENKDAVKKVRHLGSLSFGFLFSIAYIGVATNFYLNLTRVEEATLSNCSMVYSASLERNLHNFCEHVITWKTCAILGLAVPGCLNLLLGLITLWELSKNRGEDQDENSGRPSCHKLWEAYDLLTKVVSIAVTCVLLSTGAHSTMVGGTSGLKTAAIIYMIVVGMDLLTIVFFAALGIIFSICAAAVGCCCCIWCCCLPGNKQTPANEGDEEATVVIDTEPK